MAMTPYAPKQTQMWAWGGAAVAAIVVIVALGYGFDWFGGAAPETGTPAAEVAAPAAQ
ncbi:hypothetical protein LR948_18020 [Roseivivax sp. GX 12232]|uniref:hypothetical protein n=1 Tax=Roseivivax sp. GX 12232 TaxID=2900547 RepID=UPI001E6499CD|nr:hypothetical protein [Roseivivax sp. GX 12232]MCE0507267.1 hypothetical protein [Roseivivax sp. GX 12232]